MYSYGDEATVSPNPLDNQPRFDRRKILANVVVCAGLLFALSVVAGVFMYIIWGAVILSKYQEAKVGDLCDHEHIWIYTLLCICAFATFFCCAICQGVNIEVDESGDRQPGMFLILSGIVSFGSFVWGTIEYGDMTGACKQRFGHEYPELWWFFCCLSNYSIFGAIFQIAFFFFLCWANFRRQLKSAQNQILLEAEERVLSIPGGHAVSDVVGTMSSAMGEASSNLRGRHTGDGSSVGSVGEASVRSGSVYVDI